MEPVANRPAATSSATRESFRSRLVMLLAIGLVALLLVLEGFEGEGTFEGAVAITPLAVCSVLVACAALVLRHRAPALMLALVAPAHVYVTWASGSGFVLLPVAAVALYTVARSGDRRRGLILASAAATLMAIAEATFSDDAFLIELTQAAAQAFLPIALGDAVRTREDRVADMIEVEADARVQAERLRIARDLHDVVAHGLSTIAIQSGVAARLLDSDREQARDALESINATGRASLDDLRSMVGALRSSDVAVLRPTPVDPDDMSDIVAAAISGGVDVVVERSGAFPDQAGDAVIVAAHRVVQEALMNVARHAGAVRAVVSLDHHDEQVQIRVENEPPKGAPLVVESTGVGIVGMQERAESVGGTLTAEPTDSGGFRVDALLPYSRRTT